MIVVTAFFNAFSVRILAVLGLPRPYRQCACRTRRPCEYDLIRCRDRAAPGRVIPSASAALVIVDAVPIVMQWPGERAMPLSTSSHSSSVILPARNSAQYFQESVPLPSGSPCQFPRSMGPAGTKIAGIFMLAAAIIRAGVVLSQPPIRTAPSTGWLRKALLPPSQAYCDRASLKVLRTAPKGSSLATRLESRLLATPRFTSSTRCLKCAALIDVGPGVDDRDGHFLPVGGTIAHLFRAGLRPKCA